MRLWTSATRILSLFVVFATAPSFADTPLVSDERENVLGPNAGLADYLSYAQLHNAGLEAAFNRWKASLERVSQARALSDPQFTYRYFLREVETRVGPQRQAFEISQIFPWFGKLKLAGDVAYHAAETEFEAYQLARRKVSYDVKHSYYELYYLDRSLHITQENVQLLIHVEEVVRARYRAAAASHPDIIKIQVELGKLEDSLNTLRDMVAPTKAHLNAVLNRPPLAPLSMPKVIEIANDVHDEVRLFDRVKDAHPSLQGLLATINRHRLAADLAQKDFRPNWTVGLSYVDVSQAPFGANPPDNGKDVVGAAVSVNIPLWHKRISSKVNEAKLRELSAQQQREDLTHQLQARLKMALYRLRDAQRRVNLYGSTLLPKAQESLAATEAAFRNSTGSFLDLVDAQRIFLEFQLAHARAGADHGQSLAEIELLVGDLSERIEPLNPSMSLSEKESR